MQTPCGGCTYKTTALMFSMHLWPREKINSVCVRVYVSKSMGLLKLLEKRRTMGERHDLMLLIYLIPTLWRSFSDHGAARLFFSSFIHSPQDFRTYSLAALVLASALLWPWTCPFFSRPRVISYRLMKLWVMIYFRKVYSAVGGGGGGWRGVKELQHV